MLSEPIARFARSTASIVAINGVSRPKKFRTSLTPQAINQRIGPATTRAMAARPHDATASPVLGPGFLSDVLIHGSESPHGKLAKCINLNGEPQIGWEDFDLRSLTHGGYFGGNSVFAYAFANTGTATSEVSVVCCRCRGGLCRVLVCIQRVPWGSLSSRRQRRPKSFGGFNQIWLYRLGQRPSCARRRPRRAN